MIYLQSEKEQFAETKAKFDAAYNYLLQELYNVYAAKGETRDALTPIHHRMSPENMVALAQAKLRRIETLVSQPDWENDKALREKVIEECGDVANYNLYIAALCLMLLKENLQQ